MVRKGSSAALVTIQGESEVASENDLLQDFMLSGLRKAPAGELDVEVAFMIDDDGIFSVSAKDLETGEETTVEIEGQSGYLDEELQRLSDESREYLEERRAEEAENRLVHGLESLLLELDRLFVIAEKMGANPTALITITHARHAHEQAKNALTTGERREIAEHVVILEDAKAMVERLLKETDAVAR